MKQKCASGVEGPVTPSGVIMGLQDSWSPPVVTEGDKAVKRDFCWFEGTSPPASTTLGHFPGCA